MSFSRVTLLAAIAGALWGAIWMLVIGILLMLVSGLIVTPPVGIAALIGVAVAGFMLWRGRVMRPILLGAVLAIAALVLLTALSPFRASLEDRTAYQIAALLAWGIVLSRTLHTTLDGYSGQPVARYRFELLVIRLIKGLGFLIFTILVVLPFYIMGMTMI